MPWVKEELCNSCGTCVEECPADAISLREDDGAVIDDDLCIRCGTCHESCPEDAVRHDGERLPEMVAANLEWTAGLLSHYDTAASQSAFIDRITKYFTLQRKVAEQTVESLKTLGANPKQELPEVIHKLTDDSRNA